MLSSEDLELVMRFIYVPMVRKVLVRDMERIESAEFKFHEPYFALMEKTLNKVGMDIRDIKKEMSKSGISVYHQGLVSEKCNYLVICRGYREEMNLFPHLIKNEVLKYMTQYLTQDNEI
jgi:hypothetical protein